MLLEPTKIPLGQTDFHFPKDPWDWYIYLHLPYKSTIHVGKYTSPMDPMGLVVSPRQFPQKNLRAKRKQVGALDSSSTFEKFFTSQLFNGQTARISCALPSYCWFLGEESWVFSWSSGSDSGVMCLAHDFGCRVLYPPSTSVNRCESWKNPTKANNPLSCHGKKPFLLSNILVGSSGSFLMVFGKTLYNWVVQSPVNPKPSGCFHCSLGIQSSWDTHRVGQPGKILSQLANGIFLLSHSGFQGANLAKGFFAWEQRCFWVSSVNPESWKLFKKNGLKKTWGPAS